MIRFVLFFLVAMLFGLLESSAADIHSGYYYPIPKKIETHKSRVRVSIKNNRLVRLKTVEELKKNFRDKFSRSQFSILVKGNLADKIIVVGMGRGTLNTIYRARAMLDSMNFTIRSSLELNNVKMDRNHNTLDLLKMLGFKQITLSDGEKYAYQVLIK